MSRGLSATVEGVIDDVVVRPAMFVELQFDSGTNYFWTGIADITALSNTWVGIGSFLSVSGFQEQYELSASGFTVTLSGLITDNLADALTEDYQNRKAIVYLGFFDDSNSLVADPFILYSGFMDVMTIAEGADTSTIQITCENRLIELERPRKLYYTSATQQAEFPNDKGFEFVPSIQDMSLNWGKNG